MCYVRVKVKILPSLLIKELLLLDGSDGGGGKVDGDDALRFCLKST